VLCSQNVFGSPVVTGTCTTGTENIVIPLHGVGDPLDTFYNDGIPDPAKNNVVPTPPVHSAKQVNAYVVRKRQVYRGNTSVYVRGITGATSFSVRSGYKAADGQYSWELPGATDVSCAAGALCSASFPQAVGKAYYQVTWSNGVVWPPALAQAN